jgi:hypothetical protein
MRTTSLLLAAAVALVAGCQDGKYKSKDDPHGNIKVPTIESSYEMVGVGKPPLTFITTTGGWVKIIDATDNTLIHTAQIPPSASGALLRLDPDARGVTIGPVNGENAAKSAIVQPIDPSHRFEIYYQR